MKKHTVVLAAVLLGIGPGIRPAHAQAGGVRASVPFRFSVGGKTFAAGEYTLLAGSHQVRVVSAASGGTVALALANDVAGHEAGSTGRIVFRCYGERCFLRELWSPVEQYGRQLLTSRTEAESSKERRGTYFAILGTK